ncbi:hypothetical protein OH146_02400 [Salinibacterium sp. SYSU T00001]|uniref:hypothetical protein n=1 Tax=Homoserinimonas sedimenticola TaxID=2986805 RepID=UPI0022368671|nr:hypothetical protein [Salinibacterium sedimenticola]MCW4384620.1 hypothetical protein [Salinibacterium sedimenticola]
MSTTLTAERLATALPGRWRLGATNLLYWLDARHGEPLFEFDVVAASPLRLSETIEFSNPDGTPRMSRGTSRFVGGEFRWRGSGRELVHSRRWTPVGLDDSASILVVSCRRTRSVATGMNILVREGADVGELRTLVAATAERLGVSPEEFASLTWLS